jgi:hypothetical protein
MDLKGNDFVYLALGAGALYLILKNTEPLSDVVKSASNTITGAVNVVNPLLGAAASGAAIVTDPQSWTYTDYTTELLKAPFTGAQSWELFKQQPGIETGINALFTNLGLFK